MISGFLVKKGKMSSVFLENGNQVATTRCFCPPLTVIQNKSLKTDKYQAVQVAYGQKKHHNRPILGQLKKIKLKIKPKGFKEFKLSSDQIPKVGQEIPFDSVFSVGDTINAQGISKGRGFAGVIKRHGFHRQPVTRGQSDRTRAPGSIGAQTPGKVLKGKKMPGHFGVSTITVKNLKVIKINSKKHTVTISGSLPGHINSWVIIKKIK